MAMKPYPAYKNSGIEWIGEVPEHWGILPIKRITSTKITDGPHETPDFIDDGVAFISVESIRDNRIDFNYKRGYISKELHKEYSKKCKPQKGDVLLVKSGSTTGKVAMVETSTEFNIWSPLCLIRPNVKIVNSNFLLYALQSDYFQRNVQLSWSFGTQPNIGMGVIENLRLLLPSTIEQERIVSFLTHRTALIDTLIEKTTRKIALLREQRSAIINHAVTKGLDPKAPMKDSGIEWIGEVPEHWEVKKLKNICKIFGRIGFRGYTTEDIVEENEGAISLSPSNIQYDRLILEKNTYLKWDKYFESPEIQIFSGDIILVKTGSTIGKAAWIPEGTKEMTLNPQLIVLKESAVESKHLYYQTTCPFFKSSFDVDKAGGSTPTISQEKIYGFPVIIPPRDEQITIVRYLDHRTALIDTLIEKEQQRIELLKAYRQSLISEAVTGKIDVRNLEP